MSRLSTAAFSLLLVAAGSPAAAAQERAAAGQNRAEADTLLLFGASWCAPCVAELRSLRPIAEQTAPAKVLIVWQDNGIARLVPPSLGNVALAGPEEAQKLTSQFSATGGGLPFAVMIDAAGRACAQHRGPLTPQNAAAMARSCGATRHD